MPPELHQMRVTGEEYRRPGYGFIKKRTRPTATDAGHSDTHPPTAPAVSSPIAVSSEGTCMIMVVLEGRPGPEDIADRMLERILENQDLLADIPVLDINRKRPFLAISVLRTDQDQDVSPVTDDPSRSSFSVLATFLILQTRLLIGKR